jgi:hypothetical protein
MMDGMVSRGCVYLSLLLHSSVANRDGVPHVPYSFLMCPFPFACFFAISLRRFTSASAPIPLNTSPTPSICITDKLWPNATTEKTMLSIFLVTVTVTSTSEPNLASV